MLLKQMITKKNRFRNASDILAFALHFRLWRDVCFITRIYSDLGSAIWWNDCIYDVFATYRLPLPLAHPRRVFSTLAVLFERWNDSRVHSIVLGDTKH